MEYVQPSDEVSLSQHLSKLVCDSWMAITSYLTNHPRSSLLSAYNSLMVTGIHSLQYSHHDNASNDPVSKKLLTLPSVLCNVM